MSVRVMAAVWEHSQASGSGLLVLLAIADNANDSGAAWPSVETIARKARCGVRRTQDLLKELVRIGELEVGYQEARRGCNLYRVKLLRASRNDCTRNVCGGGAGQSLQIAPHGGAIQSLQIAPEPSGTINNRQEPPLSPPMGGGESEADARSLGNSETAAPKKARRRGEKATSVVWALKEQQAVLEGELEKLAKSKKQDGTLSEADRARKRALSEQLDQVKQKILEVRIG